MTPQSSDVARRHLGSLFSKGTAVGLTDDQLLDRYATRCPDLAEPAFAALVERHGPMVLGVCRSVLRDEHHAHDAFQAAFLVLARKAGSLRGGGPVAPWLHLVARRIAQRARATEGRRRAVERSAAEMSGRRLIGDGREDLGAILHAEIDGLPGRLRRPVVLCDLEGCSYDQAAESIGCPVGTVKSRLARGRGLLRDRLVRRGAALGLTVPLAASAEAVGAVPEALARDTVRAALTDAASRAAITGTTVAALVEGEIKAMGLLKIKAAGLTLLVSGVLATGLVALARAQGEAKPPPGSSRDARPVPDGEPADAGAAGRFAKLLQEHPVIRPDGTLRFRLFLMDLSTGKAMPVVDEPGQGHAYCGSPFWSNDGRQVLFDATPLADWGLSRLMAIRPGDGPPKVTHLGMGSCPSLSPDGKWIVFLSNEKGVETGVYVMDADGANRTRLGSYGRPKLSPDGKQILITSFSSPCAVTLMNIEAAVERTVALPGRRIFSIPSWADSGTIVASVGDEAADSIALIDVTGPDEMKVKSVLWKRGSGPDVTPANVAYHPGTRRCIFVGAEAKGKALYAFTAGDPAAPVRLERRGLDPNLGDLAISPDGRFLLFNTDRADREPR